MTMPIMMTQDPDRDRITLAILALGGQGGGVLADWIIEIANANGYIAQGTSVPGVAQRTGSTVYYVEMVRAPAAGANKPAPVLAMMPVPGDVDVVVASELMEAGRAILRGFVTEDRTTLIGSTHRIYAISEKAALGDGRGASDRILDAAERRSARFIGFDMEATAGKAGSLISSVMLGALSASGALPFPRQAFEEAIRHGGKAVAANLKGFAAGAEAALDKRREAEAADALPEPTTPTGQQLHARILLNLPEPAQANALRGVARLLDYQDAHYAGDYLDRVERIAALDGVEDGWALTAETARHLALWMAYEDTIRVADLKIRETRSRRVEKEVRVKADQVLTVTEYMHPRLREVCETLPASIGGAILASPWLRKRLEPRFAHGRHVRTTSLRWHLALRLVASMRRIRRSTLRYVEEQARIADWLHLVETAAARDRALALAVVRSQALIKGYGDTFERGLDKFQAVNRAANDLIGQPEAADRVRALYDEALTG
ncbi:indolepyruvate oxidoreductase subunit beta family protein [Sphingomonas sanxanigenens]|uniref:Uncharacterized protein n=1 Tax=Sphingomonas sanxanigenens DSM 19645 = NX02 TaxID=1123269 RepID=W0AEC6_9SPHN|nr:indolepyruvate oxidoreductase subunit beta family protein [Sphingomonas sanxanigenens]AHE54000.1 hypothetical protein NX02_11445 [Sphingomonas sanxanigenens DSM 19645 = NX02]